MTESVQRTRPFPLLRNLQFSPLKEGGDQYVLLWDPSGLSTEKLIVPLSYFYLLQFFDGEHSLEQVSGEYLRKFGEFLVPDRLQRLVDDLNDKLFLEGERVDAARHAALAAYRAAATRTAASITSSEPPSIYRHRQWFCSATWSPSDRCTRNSSPSSIASGSSLATTTPTPMSAGCESGTRDLPIGTSTAGS